jgi:hypothetical protein
LIARGWDHHCVTLRTAGVDLITILAAHSFGG